MQAVDDMHEVGDLRRSLNGETGRIAWRELQRPFARGVIVKVSPRLDLVDVAARIAGDDSELVAAWLRDGLLARAVTDDAIAWQARSAHFWAVVTAPWVLVQEIFENAPVTD